MASFRSFNFVLGGDLLAKALNALALLAAMRLLTPPEFADYVFVGAMAVAAFTFFNGFFNRSIVFQLVADQDLRAIQFVALGFTMLGYLVVAGFTQSVDVGPMLAGLAVSSAAIIYEVRRSIAQQAQAFRLYTAVEVGRSGLFLILTVAVLLTFSQGRAVWLVSSLALSYAVAAIAMRTKFVNAGAVTIPRLSTIVRGLWTRETGLLMLFFVLLGLTAQLPALLYRPLASLVDYAEFGVAFRYYGLLVSITSAFYVVAMPAIASVSPDQASRLVRRLLLMALFALALVFVAGVAGFIVIPIVDGGKYPGAPLLFAAMSTGLVFGVYCAIIIMACQRSGRYGILALSQFVCVVVTAAVLQLFAAAHPLAAALAMPIGLAVQLATLVLANRKIGLVGLLSGLRAS